VNEGERVSYADREWLAAPRGSGATLTFDPDGVIWWRGETVGRLEPGADAAVAAAQALCRVAGEAAAAASEHADGGVEVQGAGLVAAHARRLVGDGLGRGGTPGVVIDTTGDPGAIRSALERVPDLGMVVLAGEPAGRTLDLDLYSSVHRRGLVLVGVGPPSLREDGRADLGLAEDLLRLYVNQLADASWGSPPSIEAPWYRLRG
jgi:hypothetical protein